MKIEEVNRRNFLKFLGGSTVMLSSTSIVSLLTSCIGAKGSFTPFNIIKPTGIDDVVLAEGLNYKVLISRGTKINATEMFGDNNDYTALTMLSKDSGILWVNHESTNSFFTSGTERSRENIIKEMNEVGGSLIEIKRDNNSWSFVKESKFNKRITGKTLIKFADDVKVLGSNTALGTNSNCAGGVTPWGTIFTCEENYQDCWGERASDGSIDESDCRYYWHKHFDGVPEHYGWVVEVDPKTAIAKKHTVLGRFSHESATVVNTKKGMPVVYSGDDKKFECLYKYIGNEKNKVGTGTLYVASLELKKWLALDLEQSPVLKKHFKTQLEVMVNCRKAAKILGATALDRPEDIEIDPITGHVFISLTNNKLKANFHGHILKIAETQDYDSLTFEWEYFATGGEDNGFSCPDNLAFDKAGNLWIATDISGSAMNKTPYNQFKNNGIFVIPRAGNLAGKAYQIASAPKDAEFTGLSFDPEYKNLFLSVQHPGEKTRDRARPTSTWPDRDNIPKSSVITVSGITLDKIIKGDFINA
jgi:uncharacterized protein